jgi:exodeoxyribonuclease VII small subunit
VPNAKPGYEDLQTELDRVMLALQQEDLDVDKALEYYKRGLELVKELEVYLKTAENSVKELKAKFEK